MNEDKHFQLNEEDVEIALRYLKFHDPKNATRERAVAMLRDMHSDFHRLAHEDPEKLLELKRKVDRPDSQ